MRAWQITSDEFAERKTLPRADSAAFEWKDSDEASVRMKAGLRGEFCAIPKDADAFNEKAAERFADPEKNAAAYEGEWLFYFVELPE